MDETNDIKGKIDSIISAIGALAEISAVMRDQLIANGYTREEACKIAGDFIISSIRNNGRN